MTESQASEKDRKIGLLESWKIGRKVLRDAVIDLEWEDMEIKSFGSFSVKDILAHVIEWDKSALINAEAFLRNEPLDFGPDWDNDLFNAKAVSKWQNKSPGEVRNEFLSTTDAVCVFLVDLNLDDLLSDKNLKFKGQVVNPALFLIDPGHDLGHARQITEWREREGIRRI
jgi:hypothetical protein